MGTVAIPLDALEALLDAADKWSNELCDYIIPTCEADYEASDALDYTVEMHTIDASVELARELVNSLKQEGDAQ